VNDAKFMRYMLETKFGFSDQNLIMLTDEDQTDSSKLPTKENMLKYMDWLVEGVMPGDILFLSYSGHGGQTQDEDGDEEDGMDETILPTDFMTAGTIVDDVLHDKLCKNIPAGAKLIAVMDCCHSGTGLDLPYEYDPASSTVKVDRTAVAHNKTCRGQVVCYSGCRDDQTSADSKNLSRVAFAGALTFCFTKCIENNYPNLTYGTLLSGIEKLFEEKSFSQVVQLSAGHELDINAPFSM